MAGVGAALAGAEGPGRMIPNATTTVTVTAVAEPEPGEGTTTTERAAGVRAVIAAPSGRELAVPGGGGETISAVLLCDPVAGMAHTDRVTEDRHGTVYEVAWVAQREGLGLDHTKAGLVVLNGRAA